MNNINSKDLYTDRLDIKVPTMKEQHKLWEILINEDINQYYFPTPNRIFNKYNLSKDNIDDLKKAREIFLSELRDWKRQKPFYEMKIDSINSQEDSQRYTWSIFLKDTDTVIGQMTCQQKDDEPLDIRDVGWFIDPNYQGHGYAKEAATKVLDFMFNEVGISSIKTSAAEINPGSWKLMESLGFKYVNSKQSTYFKDDEILLAKEYYCDKDMFLNREGLNDRNKHSR